MSLMDALLLDPYPIDLSRAEVWIASRTDGVAGSGTQNDPYDGSTQAKFDNLLNVTLYYHPYMRIHLGPGTFQTSGFCITTLTGVRPEGGWKIIGSGMEVTVLKLVGMATDNNKNAAIGNNNFLDTFEVWDLTIDCNVTGQTTQKVVCNAINVAGAHIRLRRIRAINWGSQSQILTSTPPNPPLQIECFPLIGTANAFGDDSCVDCWIADCILEQPGWNNTGMTTLMNVSGGENAQYLMGYHRASAIRNCFVDSEYRINPVPIASIVISGGVATVTTRLPHGLSSTAWVRISGAVLNGNTNNSYNGSYQISGVTSPYVFTYVPNPTQTVNPTGDIWIGRFPSQPIWIASIGPASGSGPYTIPVTTKTPHFRIPGDMVAVNGVTVTGPPPPAPPPTPPTFGQVSSVSSPTQFDYTVQANPDTIEHQGNETLGVPFQACQADAGTAAVVEGNRFVNVGNGGPYHDTYSSKDIIARNNYLRGVQVGPSWSLGYTDMPLAPIPLSRQCKLDRSGTGLPGDPFMATLTTKDGSAHGFAVGETVFVTNAGPTQYNGYFTVAQVPTSSTLKYELASDPGVSSDGDFARLYQEGRVVIENNFIELGLSTLPSPASAIWFYDNLVPPLGVTVPPPYLYDQVVIRRNVIHSLDGAFDSSGYPYGLRLDMCANGIVEESIIDLNSTFWRQIWQVRSNSIRYQNNQTSAGGLLPGQLEISENPPPPVFAEIEELATLIDLACVQSF